MDEGELARVAGEDDDGMRATSDQEAGGEVDMDDEIQEGDRKTQKPRIARAPREPTSLERAVHEVTHLPIRTWCAIACEAEAKTFITPGLVVSKTFLEWAWIICIWPSGDWCPSLRSPTSNTLPCSS